MMSVQVRLLHKTICFSDFEGVMQDGGRIEDKICSQGNIICVTEESAMLSLRGNVTRTNVGDGGKRKIRTPSAMRRLEGGKS